MKILMVHNHYSSAAPSGEGRSFAAERDLLRAHGREVVCYERHSDNIPSGSLDRSSVAAGAVWSVRTRRDLSRLIARERPDVAHFQNTFPLISPSAYAACRDAGVPVVQAVRNYRHLCVNASLFRDGKPCEDCVGRVAWRGVAHACYRSSRAASAAVLAMSQTHRTLGTWTRAVDVYVTPSEFAKTKLIEGGLPADKMVVKPNFVAPDPGPGDHDGDYALFAGRLSAEKGVATLLRAARKLQGRIRIVVAGAGPLAADVRQAAADGFCEFLGAQSPAEMMALMGRARAVVVPSQWYETFGRVVVEAFSCATPVVVSDLGAVAELVDHDRTGLRFPPGDADALVAALEALWSDPAECARLGKEARAEFEDRYTSERNAQMLGEIYERVRGAPR